MAFSTYSGFAILRENNDAVWFDAITGLSTVYTATVSSHPIANGGRITDHVTTENPKWSVSAILSDADFNLNRPTLRDIDVNKKEYTNDTRTVTPVSISDQNTGLNRILPEVISQWTRDNIPTAIVTEQPKVKSAKAVADELVRMFQKREKFKFIEFDGNVSKTFDNCVFTKLEFSEDPETGEGVFPVMSFEQVSFATPRQIRVSIRNRGRQSGASSTTTEDLGAKNQPSTYSKASILDLPK